MASGSNEKLLAEADDKESVDLHKVTTSKSIRNLTILAFVLIFHSLSSGVHKNIMSQYVYSRYDEVYLGNSSTHKKPPDQDACNPNSSIKTSLQEQHAQEDSTAKLFQYSLASSIPAILTNLMLGSYSDFIGRKTIFIIMLVGRLVRDITTVVVVNFTLDLNFFFIGYGTDGLLGSVFAFYMAAFAFAADVTPPHKTRALALTVLESSKNVADAAIQAVIGYAIDYFGYFWPSIAMLGFTLIDFFIVVALIPETVDRRKMGRLSPMKSIIRTFSVFVKKGENKSRAVFMMLLMVFFFAIITTTEASLSIIYMLGKPFCWSSVAIGWFFAAQTAGQNIMSVIVMKVLHVCLSEQSVVILGLVSVCAGYIEQALSTNSIMLYISVGLSLASAVVIPAIRGIMSSQISRDKQGSLFAGLAVVQTMCYAISASIFNNIYEYTVDDFRGTVFLAMAGSNFIAAIFLLMSMHVTKRRQSKMRRILHIQHPDEKQAESD